MRALCPIGNVVRFSALKWWGNSPPRKQEIAARHEPHLALHGGWDGLDCYRAIAGGLAGILRRDGRLLLEIGADQGDSVPAVFAAAGFRCAARHKDLAGLPRCLVLQWNP